MNNVLAVVAVTALTVAAGSLLTSWLIFGLSLAVAAGCVVALECITYGERRDERTRLGREAVWQRREGCVTGQQPQEET